MINMKKLSAILILLTRSLSSLACTGIFSNTEITVLPSQINDDFCDCALVVTTVKLSAICWDDLYWCLDVLEGSISELSWSTWSFDQDSVHNRNEIHKHNFLQIHPSQTLQTANEKWWTAWLLSLSLWSHLKVRLMSKGAQKHEVIENSSHQQTRGLIPFVLVLVFLVRSSELILKNLQILFMANWFMFFHR